MFKVKKAIAILLISLMVISGVFAGEKDINKQSEIEVECCEITFEDELEYLNEFDVELTEVEQKDLENLFNKAIKLEELEKYEESDEVWEKYFTTLDTKLDFEILEFDNEFTFEDELEYLNEFDVELTEAEQKELETIFNKAIKLEELEKYDESEEVWDEYYELLENKYDNFENEYEELDGSFEENLHAVYLIQNDKLVLSTDKSDYYGETPMDSSKEMKVLHQKLWKRTSLIIPKSYLKYFKKLEIGTDGKDGILASVVQLDDLSNWALFIDSADVFNKSGTFLKEFDMTVVHEFAHVLTLNVDQMEKATDNGSYITDEGDTLKESYLNQFYKIFWKNIELEDDPYERYDNNSLNYVSEYAATNVEEDIAESFAVFVFKNKPEGNSISDKKIKFFYNYKELVVIRNEIRNSLKL